LYDAEPFALPLFEAQQFLIREVYEIPADELLDYDRFRIPYAAPFDLVVGNHMLTHAVRPAEFLATVKAALVPGGHLYLYNEPDEADFLDSGKSIFSSLNPFHLQTFDLASLVRALQANGFETIFVTHHDNDFALLARTADARLMQALPDADRDRRVAAYQTARDLAILRLPREVRGRFAAEWEAVVERAFAARLVDFDGSGKLRLVRDEA
jgi:SAM-dependent methyltransferase